MRITTEQCRFVCANTLTSRQFQIATLFGSAYTKAATVSNAVSGFRTSYIFSDDDFVAADVTNKQNPSADLIHLQQNTTYAGDLPDSQTNATSAGDLPDPQINATSAGGLPDPQPNGTSAGDLSDSQTNATSACDLPGPQPYATSAVGMPDPQPNATSAGGLPDPQPNAMSAGDLPDPQPNVTSAGDLPDPQPPTIVQYINTKRNEDWIQCKPCCFWFHESCAEECGILDNESFTCH